MSIQKKLVFLSAVLMAFLWISCSKMNDLHEKYLNEGEIIYAAKVDSVAPGSGKGRVQFQTFITSQRIDKVRIYYNDKKDSSEMVINNATGKFIKEIANLTEKGYIFQFVSIDKFGNKSLPYEVTANSYGDLFQATLTNRLIKSQTTVVNGKISLTWAGVVDKAIGCDLRYTNTSDVAVAKIVPMTEAVTTILDLKSNLKYRTLFLPTKMAIDTFYTDFKVVTF